MTDSELINEIREIRLTLRVLAKNGNANTHYAKGLGRQLQLLKKLKKSPKSTQTPAEICLQPATAFRKLQISTTTTTTKVKTMCNSTLIVEAI